MIYRNIGELDIEPKGRCVALGFFDSLHMGHLSVIQEMKRVSKKEKLISTVQTFDGFNLKGNKVVLDLNERIRIFESLDIEDVVILEFNEEFKTTSPEAFINDIIVGKLNAKVVVCGSDYTFGHKGEGDVELLLELLPKYGIKLKVVEPVIGIDQNKISTSAIKNLLDKGDVKEVARICGGRFFEYEGEISHGNRIGRTLGFPTINVFIPEDKYLVRRGVYLTRTIIDGKTYNSISNVGRKPTIVESIKRDIIETHLYDFDEDIYGKVATVQLLDFVRDERQFNGIDELRKQVLSDKDYCYRRHLNGGI